MYLMEHGVTSLQHDSFVIWQVARTSRKNKFQDEKRQGCVTAHRLVPWSAFSLSDTASMSWVLLSSVIYVRCFGAFGLKLHDTKYGSISINVISVICINMFHTPVLFVSLL